jgi:hypothetical protein
VADEHRRTDGLGKSLQPFERLLSRGGVELPHDSTAQRLPSEASTASSVWRVRSEGEQRTSVGWILFRRMYLASLLDARSPLGASGRSILASVESDQLDFLCRSRTTVGNA